MAEDTIFALATPQGRSGIAVVRLSGPAVTDVLTSLCGQVPEPRVASLLPVRSLSGAVLDQALILYFEEGRSFTGEVSAEVQLHGSPAIVSAVLTDLSERRALRRANAGEFTHRALRNGKMDLSQVEGLSALLEAETEAQRIQAQRVLSGVLREQTEAWRSDLLSAIGLVEALIDFSEEEIDVIDFGQVTDIIKKIEHKLNLEATGVEAAERVRAGFQVALLGPPNSGKSSLLNAMARRDVALTSEVAGTTRDVIEVHLDLGGIPVTFLDTAGLRESDDRVEAMGIDLARVRARTADVRVWFDAMSIEKFSSGADILISPKSDLAVQSDGLPVSAVSGQGIPELLEAIGNVLTDRVASIQSATHARHRAVLLRGVEALSLARSELRGNSQRIELAAEHLRGALIALDELIGRVGVEDILGEVFSNFCIGK